MERFVGDAFHCGDSGGGDFVDDDFEEFADILRAVVAEAVAIGCGPAFFSGGVDDGEVETFVWSVEVCEQVEDFVDDVFGAGVWFVDFVNDDNGFEVM